MSLPTPPTLEEHLRQAFWDLQRSLTNVLVSISADPNVPQDLARRLGLNKNLTWKVSRIVQAVDPFASVQHLPGPSGLEIFLKAVRREGASEDALAAVRSAMLGFESMVREHCGDRATLELILDSMATDEAAPLERSRKLSFQGNSGIWGVQTQDMLTTFFLAPSRGRPDLVDQAIVGGMLNLRRFRPDATWPLVRQYDVHDDGTPIELPPDEAIDPDYESAHGLKLIGDFCTGDAPDIRAVDVLGGTLYELAGGRVGNTGAFSFVTGHLRREFAPVHADDEDEVFELHANLSIPTEALQLDLIVHEAIEFPAGPDFMLVGRLHGNAPTPADRRENHLLPTGDRVRELGRGLPAITTPRIPRYDELVQKVLDRAGWNRDEFHGYRVTMKYPPIPATAVLKAMKPKPAR